MNRRIDAHQTQGEALELNVNGKTLQVNSPAVTRLADVLRDELGLTGTKIGCNAGDCGACTVLIDGRQVCSCLTAVGQAAGRQVTTGEGLAQSGRVEHAAAHVFDITRRSLEQGAVAFFDVRVVKGVEVVDANHAVAAGQQRFGHMRTKEAAGSGHNNVHAVFDLFGRVRDCLSTDLHEMLRIIFGVMLDG